MKLAALTPCGLLTTLLCASCVVTRHPLGTEPDAELAVYLQGVWIEGEVGDDPHTLQFDAEHLVVFDHMGGQDLWMVSIDHSDEVPEVITWEAVARRHGEDHFLSIRVHDDHADEVTPTVEVDGQPYLFARLHRVDQDSFVVDVAEIDVFLEAVESGRLEGTGNRGEGGSSVRIEGPPGAIEAFLDELGADRAFKPADEIFRRLAPDRSVPPGALRGG